MRFAITAIARGGGQKQSESVSDFVRRCKSGGRALSRGLTLLIPRPDFERFTPFVRELSKKQQVTKQSVIKIEQGSSDSCVWDGLIHPL